MTLRTLLQLVLAIGICGTVGQARAYEASPNSSSTDPCAQVILSAFTPPPFSVEKNNTAVPPQSEFSFLVSKTANSSTIIVKIKDEQVPVKVTTINNGFLVKGKIPATIKGKYIRLDIYAKGPSGCDKADGWLLKVGG